MVCFDKFFYFFLNTYLGLYRSNSGPVLAHCRPYRPEWKKNKNKNKSSQTCVQLRRQSHGASRHIGLGCANLISTLVLSKLL